MPELNCKYCKYGEERIPSETKEILASIETLMSCGCGGTVSHSIFRCTHCDNYYLSSYYEHKTYGSDVDYSIMMIDEKDAKKMIAQIKKCKDPENARCGCGIHKKSEFLEKRIKGKTKFSESYPK